MNRIGTEHIISRLQRLAVLVLTLVPLPACCQTVTRMLESGWRSAAADSIPPIAGYQYRPALSGQATVYSARVEYPELIPLEQQQLERWGLEADMVPSWPEISTTIGMSRRESMVDISFMPLIKRGGTVYAIDSYKLVIECKQPSKAPSAVALNAADSESRYTRSSVLAQGRWVKIAVSESGVYRISDKKLRSLGFQDPSKVRLFGYGGALLPESGIEGLPDDLPMQSIWRGNGYMLFYAQGPESLEWGSNGQLLHRLNNYSDKGYYFLSDNCQSDSTEAGSQPVTGILETASADSVMGSLISTFRDCVYYDPDEWSWYHSGRRLFEEYDYATGSGKTYKLAVKGMTDGTAYLTVAFSSADAAASRLKVSADGNDLGTLYLPGLASQSAAMLEESTYSFKTGAAQSTSVRLVHERTAGASGHLDYLNLCYNRSLDMDGLQYLRFGLSHDRSRVSFSISGSTPDVQVWQIGTDGSCILPSQLQNDTISTFACNVSKNDVLLAVNVKADFPEPDYVGTVENQNLHATAQADMVIVVPESGQLTAQAERLAQAHRDLDGLNVLVVGAGQIYHEYSSGTPDATAIRRFMKMLYDRAPSMDLAPRYLLLMGSGAWDNRMHVSDFKGCKQEDYLPCYESDNSLSHTSSYVMEDYFGLLDDGEGSNLLTEKTDLGVGRLPVTTATQARQVVDKIIDYMQGTGQGKWQNEILVLGDDGDDNTHMEDANAVAGLMEQRYPDKRITRMFWDTYPMEVSASYNSYPTLRSELLSKLEDGVLMVNYSGHGSMDVLSHELVLTKADAMQTISKRLPFWFLASCDIAPFDQPLENFGCNLILNPDGGAVSLVSTTRTVYSSLNESINRSFAKYILASGTDGARYTVGDALRLAKNELVSSGGQYYDCSQNKLHYVLLGDPALKLRNAQYSCVVDSFAGMAAMTEGLEAGAGSVMEVKGHIELDGVPQTGFNGLLYNTVYDSEREIVCLNNLKTASQNFTYTDRDKILSAGTDSVSGGKFSFTFPVPLDINYSGEQGLINLLAVAGDSKSSAAGTFSNFTVGGTAIQAGSDTIGPKISLYLNSPSLQYGGKVNRTPTLVATISDESGVNAWGNGLGHDITLVIDGERSLTWTLNQYYEPENGDWTGGRILFRIPEALSEGRHRLTLRAWDAMNNSNSVQLEFQVVENLAPGVEVNVSESPAREQCSFIVSHDRPMQDAAIEIQVYDSRGVMQWHKSVTDSGSAGVSLVDWNLCGSGTQRMPTGLYIVRAVVSDGEASRSAQCKFVIAAP